MVDPTTLALFSAAALVLNLTPGPDMLYTLTRAATTGPRAGYAAAVGNFVGTLAQTLAIAVGLGALLAQSAAAFTALRWCGAAYLVFVGAQMIWKTTGPPAAGEGRETGSAAARPKSLTRVSVEAFLIHTLNPKVVVFFLAFLPQFVDPAQGSATAQMVALGLWFAFQASLVLAVMSALVGRARRVMSPGGAAGRWLRRVAGGLFIGLGAKLGLAA